MTVLPGTEVSDVNFGNQKLKPGSISGIKWLDANGNRQQDEDEVGLAGVTIYLDSNFNNQLDDGERFTVTLADDPATAVDETGQYRFEDVEPLQSYWVQEVIPEGYAQTFPAPWPWEPPFGPEVGIPEIEGPNSDFIIDRLPFFPTHNVYVDSGADVTGINFGNREIPEPAFAEGMAWADTNGNGQRDDGERGIAGIRIFADTNMNGVRDWYEGFVFTQRDDPTTEIDEAGRYKFEILSGNVAILPEASDLSITAPSEGGYKLSVALAIR